MKIAVVRLRGAGNITSFRAGEDIHSNDYVIIEADRGLDYGEVLHVDEETPSGPLKSIVRKVTAEDLKKIKENKVQAREALRTCARKIKEYKLLMKMVEAEYSFDKKKIIFYFTSEERVDFRELVKDLAKVFRIRIEMRQIGVRDETRLFGGVGPCGKGLCCATFLKNFEPVSIKMAKQQRLPLNPSKISGICGRLMCCLSYEHKHYRELAKGLPKEGQTVNTPKGKGKVISVNILKRLLYVEFEDGHLEKIAVPEGKSVEIARAKKSNA